MSFAIAIVGAGPAGSLAANLLADRGLDVVLIDKADFPRTKVCGCCINGWAQAALRQTGFPNLLSELGARRVQSVLFALKHRRATICVPDIYAVSRSLFDAALVESAVRKGVAFLPNTRATLGPIAGANRIVQLRSENGASLDVCASVVLAADGIGGDLLRTEPGADFMVRRHSRIGLGVTLDRAPVAYEPGTIYMACGVFGYTGIVRTEGDSIDIAAALDPPFVKEAGGAARAATQMIEDARLPAIPGLDSAPWRGTQPLTRRRRQCAFERVFVIGDAAAYVEPFTGDGIAWALWSAIAVADFAIHAANEWTPALAQQWTRRYKHLLGSRQRVSRLIAELLRSQTAMRFSLSALSLAPSLARPIVNFLHPMR